MMDSASTKGRVRRLQASDSEAIASIYNVAVAAGESVYHVPALTDADARRLLFDVPARFECYGYETVAGVVGWGGLMRYHPREAYQITAELVAYVAPDQRRHGIGRALVQHALARAAELEFRTIVLLLQKTPAHLLAWAVRLGFRSTGYMAAALPVGTERRDILVFQHFIETSTGAPR
jgi:phosphinothricin acetyltransferase